MSTLRNAAEATPRIKDELQLADAQWLFFDTALKNMNQSAASGKALSDVFVSSENLLSVMDSVTGLYSSLKTIITKTCFRPYLIAGAATKGIAK